MSIMPQGDGLSFIEQLKNQRLKKIFLTGIANNDQVVEAFNKGKIDRYIKKLSNDAAQELKQYAKELQVNYFCDASKNLFDDLPDLMDLLSHPKVLEFFNEFIKQHHIEEFYLLEEAAGTFLLIDKDKTIRILCLHSAAMKQDVIGDLRLRDDISPEQMEQVVQNKKLATFIYSHSENSTLHMQDYFFDCHTIEGTNINYAVIPNISVLELEMDRISVQ